LRGPESWREKNNLDYETRIRNARKSRERKEIDLNGGTSGKGDLHGLSLQGVNSLSPCTHQKKVGLWMSIH